MRSWLPNLPRRFLIMLVTGYRLVISPGLRRSCRFEPSCSAYSLQALQAHGAAAGSYLSVLRVCRCHPLNAGGYDPVPAQAPALFRHLVAWRPGSASASPSRSNDKTSS